MAKKPQKVAYVVFVGTSPGIYKTWEECQKQVHRYPNAQFQGYLSQGQADADWEDWNKKENTGRSETGSPIALDNDTWHREEPVRQQPIFGTEPVSNTNVRGHETQRQAYVDCEHKSQIGETYAKHLALKGVLSLRAHSERIPQTRNLPGAWPEESSPESSPDIQQCRSKYFESDPVEYPVLPPQPKSAASACPKYFPPSVEGLFFYDPPLQSQIVPSLKRPASIIIDLTDDNELDELHDNGPPLGKRLKMELSVVDDPRNPEPAGGTNTVHELHFLAEMQRKEAELCARKQPAEEKKVKLSAEQKEVLKMALRGNNIFLTGAAGSGKTVTLKEIIRKLREIGKVVEVVAPTGMAALPLNGRTTFSFAGWGPDDLRKPIKKLLGHRKQRVVKAIMKLDVLVIEEISMVENQFLERLNLLFQDILNNELDLDGNPLPVAKLPFGGKQVIFIGDFYQLPPVKPFAFCLVCGEEISTKKGADPICMSDHCRELSDRVKFKPGDKWAFRAPVWRELDMRHVHLQQIHRQKDSKFQDILNKFRNGTALSVEEWRGLERRKQIPQYAFAVRLMSLINQVKAFNNRELAAIKFESHRWTAYDDCIKLLKDNNMLHDPKLQEYTESLRDHRFQEDLELKFGAKVVLLYNLNHELGLVNGSQGTIVGFLPASDDEVHVKKMTGDHKEWRLEQVKHFRQQNLRRPVVQFTNGVKIPIPVVASASLRGGAKLGEQYVVCRTQLPLTLGWALSIHKSQGMTLNYVEVNRRDIFESGQLYVAMSRATELEGLNVTGGSREQQPMDKDVLEFYKTTKWETLMPSKPCK
jgi:ATP-dependent DNA helicase PIF1